MTPQEMNEQLPPSKATRHAISVVLGCRVFYTDTQAWNGLAWCDVGSTLSYSTPLSDPPYLHVSKSYSASGKVDSPVYTDAKYKGD